MSCEQDPSVVEETDEETGEEQAPENVTVTLEVQSARHVGISRTR